MAKENLPNDVSSGIPNVGNLTSEQTEYNRLFNSLTRTQSGEGTFVDSPSSGLSYTTSSYPADVDVFNKGEEGLMNMFAKYILVDYNLTGDEVQLMSDNATAGASASEKIANAFNADADRYAVNTKMADNMQTLGDWALTGAGVLTAESANAIVNDTTIRVTEPDNVASFLNIRNEGVALDLSKLDSGEVSTDDDFIILAVRSNDPTLVDDINFGFSSGATWDGGNAFTNVITNPSVTMTADKWYLHEVKKSAFSKTGTVDWSNIQSLQMFWNSLINAASVYVEYQFIQLVKKDPTLDIPNAFQYVNVAEWKIATGFEYFIGKEFGKNTWKNLSLVATRNGLVGTVKNLNPIIGVILEHAEGTPTTTPNVGWEIDPSNYLTMALNAGVLRTIVREGGVDSTVDEGNLTVNAGDKLSYSIKKEVNDVTFKLVNLTTGDTVERKRTTNLIGYGSISIGIQSNRVYKILSTSNSEIGHARHSDFSEVSKASLDGANFDKDVDVTGSTITVSKGYDNQRIFFTMPSLVENATITMIINSVSRTLKKYETDGSIVNATTVNGGLTEVYDDGVNFILAPRGGAIIKSIQSGETALDGTLANVVIDTIDLDNSYAYVTIASDGNAPSEKYVSVKLTTSTNLQLEASEGEVGRIVRWFVVEYTKLKSKQSGSVSETVIGAEVTVNISSVDLARSILVFSYRSTNINSGNSIDIAGKFNSSTQITLLHEGSSSATTTTIEWQVLEFE